MPSYLNILRASFKKDFLFQYSYKLSFFTELFFAFLLIFFLFFLSESFNFSEEYFYSRYKGEFFLFSITGFSMVNLMGQCYSSVTLNLREAQSFGYIEELYVTKNKFIFLSISSVLYTFTTDNSFCVDYVHSSNPDHFKSLKWFAYFLVVENH